MSSVFENLGVFTENLQKCVESETGDVNSPADILQSSGPFCYHSVNIRCNCLVIEQVLENAKFSYIKANDEFTRFITSSL